MLAQPKPDNVNVINRPTVDVGNTPNVTIANAPTVTLSNRLEDQFQLQVRVPIRVGSGVAQLQLTPAQSLLIEQTSVDCSDVVTHTVRIHAETPPPSPPGFTVDSGLLLVGSTRSTVSTVPYASGWSGSFAPPTAVRMLASASLPIFIEIFRGFTASTTEEGCFISLSGHWLQ